MKSITAHAPLIEMIFLIGLVLGGVCILLNVQPFDITITSVSLFGLGVAWFLSAYRAIELPEGAEATGMKELLQHSIVPKVLWISMAVSVIALALFVLDSDASGYRPMFLIGGTTLAIELIITAGMAVSGVRIFRSTVPVLLRAGVMLTIDAYFLLR